MRKPIIGVMGPGEAGEQDIANALELGRLIAEHGWVLLTGGRNSGVMHAATQGAREAGGLTIGILPTTDLEAISEHVDVPVITDMGSARNNINVLTSSVVIACGMGSGTASEVALAIKAGRPVILLKCGVGAEAFFTQVGGAEVQIAADPADAVAGVSRILGEP